VTTNGAAPKLAKPFPYTPTHPSVKRQQARIAQESHAKAVEKEEAARKKAELSKAKQAKRKGNKAVEADEPAPPPSEDNVVVEPVEIGPVTEKPTRSRYPFACTLTMNIIAYLTSG